MELTACGEGDEKGKACAEGEVTGGICSWRVLFIGKGKEDRRKAGSYVIGRGK